MTKRSLSLIILFLLVVLVVGGSYLVRRTDLLAGSGGQPPEAPAGDPGIYSEHAPYYDISATYATSTPLHESAGERADQIAVGLMKGFITTTVAQFKIDGNFANLTTRDLEMMGYNEGRKQSLQINHLSSQSSSTISYIFNINTDTLGAHGNTYFKTFTFARKNGATLQLGDLFVSNTKYLDLLSATSRTELPKILGELSNLDMISAGTAPEERNFEHFFLDDHSLVILFPPYAVAAYAAGPQTLAIPRSTLREVLKPEYR